MLSNNKSTKAERQQTAAMQTGERKEWQSLMFFDCNNARRKTVSSEDLVCTSFRLENI